MAILISAGTGLADNFKLMVRGGYVIQQGKRFRVGMN